MDSLADILVAKLCSACWASSLRQLAIKRASLIFGHRPFEQHDPASAFLNAVTVRRSCLGGL